MHLQPTDRWRGETLELFLLRPQLVSAEYVRWLNDPEVNRYLESRFGVADQESTRAFVEQALEHPGVLFLGIRSRAFDRHVGNIKLGPIDRNHGLGEIGIMIGDREAWGRGIGAQAIALLAQIARYELGLRKLTAGCYASNAGSVSAFKRAGFSIEAQRAAHVMLDGRPEGVVLMARFI